MRDRRDWQGVPRPGKLLGLRATGWGVALTALVVGGGTLCSLLAHGLGVPATGPWSAPRLAATLAVMLAAYGLAVRVGEWRPAAELALPALAPELGAGLAGGILSFALVMALLIAGGAYTIGAPPPGPPWHGLQIGFGAGVAEELVFRGVLMRLLWEAFGPRAALLASSVVFGLAHLLNPDHNLMGAVSIIVEAGLTLGAVYLLTGRLWANIGAHAGWNFAQGYLFGAPVSGNNSSDHFFLVTPVPGVSAFLTGGEFGPEASVAAVAVGGIAAVLLLLRARQRAAAAWPVP